MAISASAAKATASEGIRYATVSNLASVTALGSASAYAPMSQPGVAGRPQPRGSNFFYRFYYRFYTSASRSGLLW
jgi:hypothetical protein